jgi:hypothetical protein
MQSERLKRVLRRHPVPGVGAVRGGSERTISPPQIGPGLDRPEFSLRFQPSTPDELWGDFWGVVGGALGAAQDKTAARRAVICGGNCGGEPWPPHNHESPVERLFVSTHVRSRSPTPHRFPGPSDPSPACPNRHATAPCFDVRPLPRTRLRPGHKEAPSAEDLISCLRPARLLSISTRPPRRWARRRGCTGLRRLVRWIHRTNRPRVSDIAAQEAEGDCNESVQVGAPAAVALGSPA